MIEVHGKRDAVRFIETRCGERAPIYVPDPARKRSEESFDTENKGSFLSLFLSVVDDAMVYPCAHREPVGEKERKTQAEREKERERVRDVRSSRGAINRRKQSLISRNFNSQSVKRACSR